MRAAGLGQRQALGHDRMDAARSQQVKQRAEVLPEPHRIAGTSTDLKSLPNSTDGKHLAALPQLLDLVCGDAPAGREQAPKRYNCGRRIPLDPRSPALV